jgi:hypothetical protein
VNVDEFLQEAETLSVQDMPRSASSLSVRTDASGAAVSVTSAVKRRFATLTTHELSKEFSILFIIFTSKQVFFMQGNAIEFPCQSQAMKN